MPDSKQDPTIEALNELAKTVDGLAQRVESLELTHGTVKKEPAKPAPKPKLPSKAFTVDGNKYKFKYAKFYHNGKKVLAEDAIKDKDFLAEIVKNNPNALEEA